MLKSFILASTSLFQASNNIQKEKSIYQRRKSHGTNQKNFTGT